jgi:hypothetical protein
LSQADARQIASDYVLTSVFHQFYIPSFLKTPPKIKIGFELEAPYRKTAVNSSMRARVRHPRLTRFPMRVLKLSRFLFWEGFLEKEGM